MIKRMIAGAAGWALMFGGVALAAAPAQALTGAPCDDGDAWSWSIANPARYQAGPHEAVVGLSDAIRTVTIKAPTGCAVEAGDTWRMGRGRVECRLAGAAASHPVQVQGRHRSDELQQRALHLR